MHLIQPAGGVAFAAFLVFMKQFHCTQAHMRRHSGDGTPSREVTWALDCRKFEGVEAAAVHKGRFMLLSRLSSRRSSAQTISAPARSLWHGNPGRFA
jgi:hypothetical protein